MKQIAHFDDAALLAEIRRRPAYHLACIYLGRVCRGGNDRYNGDQWCQRNLWPTVTELCHLLEANLFGFKPSVETLMVALADTGYTLIQRKGEPLTNFGEVELLELQRQTSYERRLGYKPNRRLAKYSDPIAVAASSEVH